MLRDGANDQLFEQLQEFHDTEARHWQALLNRAQRLPTFLEETRRATFDVSGPQSGR